MKYTYLSCVLNHDCVTYLFTFSQTDNTNNLTVLPKVDSNHCLVQCLEPGCHSRHCCVHNNEELETVTTGSDSFQQNSKVIIPTNYC